LLVLLVAMSTTEHLVKERELGSGEQKRPEECEEQRKSMHGE